MIKLLFFCFIFLLAIGIVSCEKGNFFDETVENIPDEIKVIEPIDFDIQSPVKIVNDKEENKEKKVAQKKETKEEINYRYIVSFEDRIHYVYNLDEAFEYIKDNEDKFVMMEVWENE